MYDVTSAQSFQNVKKWLMEIVDNDCNGVSWCFKLHSIASKNLINSKNRYRKSLSATRLICVGKCRATRPSVLPGRKKLRFEFEFGKRYMTLKLKYFESSAKLDEGIWDIFYHLTELGLEKKLKKSKQQQQQAVVQLEASKKKKKKKSFCVV